jgi:toxin YoeB
MPIDWSGPAHRDYQVWLRSNRAIADHIDALLADAVQHPFEGLGKPERLKHGVLRGCWSRRITHGDRLVYSVDGDSLYIIMCRGHY